MAQWQWWTQERNGDQIADVGVALTARKMVFQLNRPGVVTASLRANDPRARRDALGGLRSGVHELKVYRDGIAQETVFQLTNPQPSLDANTARVALEWQGIASYLQDALILGQASAFSGTTLPWTWINALQARTGGSYGITQGAVTGTAPTRTKTVEKDSGLLDTIIQLSGSDPGFDFTINTARQYVEWHEQRGADNGIVLEYGVNVQAISYGENTGPGEIVTDITVVGPPGTTPVSASDAIARTLYGRREASLTFFADFEASGVTNGQLQGHADAAILERTGPVIIPAIRLVRSHQSIPWGSYWLGDTVTVRAEFGVYDTINALYRIVQITVDLDDDDNETITLGVNRV